MAFRAQGHPRSKVLVWFWSLYLKKTPQFVQPFSRCSHLHPPPIFPSARPFTSAAETKPSFKDSIRSSVGATNEGAPKQGTFAALVEKSVGTWDFLSVLVLYGGMLRLSLAVQQIMLLHGPCIRKNCIWSRGASFLVQTCEPSTAESKPLTRSVPLSQCRTKSCNRSAVSGVKASWRTALVVRH